MFSRLKRYWEKLPVSVRKTLYVASKPAGIPYVWTYLSLYQDIHKLPNFAGNLPLIKDEYIKSPEDKRQLLSEQFNGIMNGLVMKNGVKKTTFSGRHNKILETVLPDERFRLKKVVAKVLDIPSSFGASSLDAYSILNRYYTITCYVLGDLFWKIIYDRDRECIFDEDGDLLQVKRKTSYFSIYRPHLLGDEYKLGTACVLLPFKLIAWYLRTRYEYRPSNRCSLINLTHPHVDDMLKNNGCVLRMKKMDVLKHIDEKFDIIMSWNLLLRQHFPREQIMRGFANLADALNEDGLLIIASDDAYSISRKSQEKLMLLEQSGEL